MTPQATYLLVLHLLASPITPETDRQPPAELPGAVARGESTRVAELLARGADPNQLAKFRISMLSMACERGDDAVANLLLDAGASVFTVSSWGETPLFAAVRHASVAVVERLLAAGADVNVRAKFGRRPLMAACTRGDVAIVDRLLAAGAELEPEAEGGVRALHFAARSGKQAVVKRLVAAGAKLDEHDRSGADARLLAFEAGHFEVADLLAREMRRRGLALAERAPRPTQWDRLADVPWEQFEFAVDDCIVTLAAQRGTRESAACLAEGVEVLLGDLTGDGVAEAVVALHLRPELHRPVVRVLVYELRERKPTMVASLPPIEALGELRIDHGILVVGVEEGLGTPPSRYRLTSTGLQETGRPPA